LSPFTNPSTSGSTSSIIVTTYTDGNT
jgi:hypothetical protein